MIKQNQSVCIKWTKLNKKYFVLRGYLFTAYDQEFYVDISDLPYSSKANVEVICDYCGKEYTAVYRNIQNGRRNIDKDSCRDCVGKKCSEITLEKRKERLYSRLQRACGVNNYKLLSTRESLVDNITLIDYECPMHGIQHMRAANLLYGKKCPQCAEDKLRARYQLDKNIVISEISKYGGILLNPNDYQNNQTKNLRIICPECKNEFITSFRSFVQHNGQVCCECSKSSESLGERRIRHYLENKSIEFEQEYWFKDCRDIKPLPFDFYVPSQNLIIEFDGRQHFGETNYFGYSYEKTNYHDKIKNDYCKSKNIDMLRIPYWRMESIEKILDNKLNNSHKDIV